MSDTPSQSEVIKAWLSKGDGTCDCRKLKHRQSLVRMLAALWLKQTREERASHTTLKRNGVGFNAYDARGAAWMLEQTCDRGTDLPVEVAWKAKFLLTTYARQLAEIKELRDGT